MALSGSLWLSLALCGSLWLAVRLSLALSGSLWLSLALCGSLSGSLWLTLALSSSLKLSIALRVCLQSPCSARSAADALQHFNQPFQQQQKEDLLRAAVEHYKAAVRLAPNCATYHNNRWLAKS